MPDDLGFNLPPFRSAAEIFIRAAEDLRPIEPVSAADAAERHLHIYDPRVSEFRQLTFDRAPFARRPLEAFSSGLYRLVAIMGPSQTAKSTILMAAMAWAVRYAPADWIAVFPDQVTSRDFSNSKWCPTVSNSPDIEERLRQVANPLATWRQHFRGMTSWFIWPVASQFRMRTCRWFSADDFDAIPEDIDGEGDPITLLQGRTPAFEGRECGIVTSSPALGRDKGIEALVSRGTDERLRVPCPECGTYFELNLEAQLDFKRTSNPADAASTVHLRGGCGCIIEPRHRSAMIARAVFASPGQTVDDLGNVVGDLPASSIASFRIDGLAAFVPWSRLAELLREAEIEFENRQAEGALRGFWNTRAGRNYKSQAEAKTPIEVDDLRKRRSPAYRLGTLPEWALYTTAAVDVQGNRFACQVIAWGHERRSAIVDRFDILEHAEGPVRPHRDALVWDAITARVIDRVVPFAGDPGRGFRPAVTAIDSQGLDGVTANARAYQRRLRKAWGGQASDWRIMLSNGMQTLTAPELGRASFELDDQNKRLPDAVPIFNLGVNELKTTIDTRLRFTDGGAGSIAFPEDFAAEHFDELTAEEIVEGRWQKKTPGLANETLDLMVMATAAQMRLRVERVDWSDPPVWAVPVPIGAAAVETAAAPRGRRLRSKGIG